MDYKGIYEGKKILALADKGEKVTRSQTAKAAVKAITAKYGSVVANELYYHIGNGNWKLYSLASDKRRTGKIAGSLDERNKSPHKFDWEGIDTKDGNVSYKKTTGKSTIPKSKIEAAKTNLAQKQMNRASAATGLKEDYKAKQAAKKPVPQKPAPTMKEKVEAAKTNLAKKTQAKKDGVDVAAEKIREFFPDYTAKRVDQVQIMYSIPSFNIKDKYTVFDKIYMSPYFMIQGIIDAGTLKVGSVQKKAFADYEQFIRNNGILPKKNGEINTKKRIPPQTEQPVKSTVGYKFPTKMSDMNDEEKAVVQAARDDWNNQAKRFMQSKIPFRDKDAKATLARHIAGYTPSGNTTKTVKPVKKAPQKTDALARLSAEDFRKKYPSKIHGEVSVPLSKAVTAQYKQSSYYAGYKVEPINPEKFYLSFKNPFGTNPEGEFITLAKYSEASVKKLVKDTIIKSSAEYLKREKAKDANIKQATTEQTKNAIGYIKQKLADPIYKQFAAKDESRYTVFPANPKIVITQVKENYNGKKEALPTEYKITINYTDGWSKRNAESIPYDLVRRFNSTENFKISVEINRKISAKVLKALKDAGYTESEIKKELADTDLFYVPK